MHASRLTEIEPAPLSNSDILKKAASMTLEHSSPETIKSAQRSRVVNVKGKTKTKKPFQFFIFFSKHLQKFKKFQCHRRTRATGLRANKTLNFNNKYLIMRIM